MRWFVRSLQLCLNCAGEIKGRVQISSLICGKDWTSSSTHSVLCWWCFEEEEDYMWPPLPKSWILILGSYLRDPFVESCGNSVQNLDLPLNVRFGPKLRVGLFNCNFSSIGLGMHLVVCWYLGNPFVESCGNSVQNLDLPLNVRFSPELWVGLFDCNFSSIGLGMHLVVCLYLGNPFVESCGDSVQNLDLPLNVRFGPKLWVGLFDLQLFFNWAGDAFSSMLVMFWGNLGLCELKLEPLQILAQLVQVGVRQLL